MSKLNTTEAVNAEINDTLALLGTEYNLNATLRKNIVLFVGISGTGKSTLVQFLAGNPNLRAIRDGPASDYYISDGNDKVSASTTESKTLLPELVLIPGTDTVLADCPGYKDTRSAKHDIAAAVFTKQLLDKSEKVKIMVVTAHHSVRKGVERKGFTDLLAHVTKFIKNIDKYEGSIGLLVTKVDNPTVEDENGDLQYVPDNVIIAEIGSFMRAIKVELVQKATDSDSVSRQIQLLDIFIAREYSKIGIFRRPTKAGELTKIPRMIKNKDAMNKIMNNALQTRQVAPNDFGLSLSVDSMHIISKMRETLNTNLSNLLDEYIRVYTQPPLDSAASNIESMKKFTSRSIAVVDFLAASITPNMVVTHLMDRIQILDPANTAQQYADWNKQQQFVQFLESIAPTNKDTNDFIKYRTRIVDFKDKMTANVELMGGIAEKTIDQAIGAVITEVVKALEHITVNLELSSQGSYKQLLEHIDDIYNTSDQFKSNIQDKPNLSFTEFFFEFKNKFQISKNQAQKLETFRSDIEFFKSKVTTTFTDGHQEKWLVGLTVPLNNIKKIAKWYSFVADSYTKLIDGENLNVVTGNKRNLKNWTSFKQVLKELGTNKALDNYLESRQTLSDREQTDLNNLIDAVQPSIDHTCQSSKLIVKGNFIKLSAVKATFIPKCASFRELYIFATQLVVIDESLTEPMKNVYIVAPTWKIKGTKSINLRGLDGNPIRLTQAGNPGQPGGNFIGIGDKFVNGNELTIDVSGGDGSNGQDGDNGQNGEDGRTPPVPETTDWHTWASTDECTTRIKKDEVAGHELQGERIFKMFGSNGSPGIRGGNGGKPGFGAKPGNILLDANSNINKLAYSGKDGVEGRGGKGGKGGEHGKMRLIKCHMKLFFPLYEKQFSYTHISFENKGHAENGDHGISGVDGNSTNAEEPRSHVPLATVAGQYKQYFQQKPSNFSNPGKFIDRFVSKRRKRSVPAFHAAPVVSNLDWAPQPLAIGSKSKSLGTKSWTGEFSLSSFMALADVLLRKVMKTKPTNVESHADHTWENLLVQAEVLKIVEKCEKVWNDLNQLNTQPTPFDPLCLQKELNWRLRQLADKSLVK